MIVITGILILMMRIANQEFILSYNPILIPMIFGQIGFCIRYDFVFFQFY